MASLFNQLTSFKNLNDTSSSTYYPNVMKCSPQSNFDDSTGTLTTVDDSENSSDDDFPLKADFEASQAVRFSPAVSIQMVPCHESYTKKERSCYWYSAKDLKKIEAKREKVISRMETGKPEREDHPYRGLEASTKEGKSRSTRLIKRILNAVLDTQNSHCIISPDCAGKNAEHIAFTSKNISSVNIVEALRTAKEDEREATAIHFTDNIMRRRSLDEDLAKKELASPARQTQQKEKKKEKKARKSGSRRTKSRNKARNNKSRLDPPGSKAVENFTAQKMQQTKCVRFSL